MSPSIAKALLDTREKLRSHHVNNADQEAKWLLQDVAGFDSSDLLDVKDKQISEEELKRLDAYVRKRIDGMPLSRILGYQEFWGLKLYLSEDTLDPRQDTELIPEIALKSLPKEFSGPILDLGTGSGCIALALLSEFPQSRCIAIDKAFTAVCQARFNAKINHLDGRFHGVCSDWTGAIEGQFPLIVSNPPYIKRSDLTNLDEIVSGYDPQLALDGGESGFDSLEKIFTRIKKHLLPGGMALIEIGFDQSAESERLIEKHGLTLRNVHLDSSGIPRVVEISYGDK